MSASESGGFIARCTKGTLGLLLWTGAWVGTLLLVDKAVLYGWTESRMLIAAGVIVNALLGLVMIWSYLRHLKGLDELQRKIQLDALAVGMGAGVVGSVSYSLLVTTGYVADQEVSDILLLMVVAYMASIIIGQIRYR